MTEIRPRSTFTTVIAILLPLTLITAAVLLFLPGREPGEEANSGAAAELAALSQSIPLHAASAASGSLKAFDALDSALSRLSALAAVDELPGSAALWQRLERDARIVAAAKDAQATVQRAAESVASELPEFSTGAGEILAGAGAPLQLQRFGEATGDLSQSLRLLVQGAGDIDRLTVTATTAADYLARVLAALGGDDEEDIDVTPLQDSALLAQLEAVQAVFDRISAATNEAVDSAPALLDIRESTRALARTADTPYSETTSAAGTRSTGGSPMGWLPAFLVAAAALLSIYFAAAYFRASRLANSAEHQAEQNERNQQAILRLLDELGSLADGDLTVQATVTEDITGAIADSINYAIEALRDLVATINDTAIMVDSAAKQTEAAAHGMSASAHQQAHEVAATTDALGAIIASIEEVAGNAERSSDVARHSVDVAHKGGDAVRRTIDGMNTIRETIQETSKRIKRLGESSQEIGNIVELINDIAEQTNILALNASIQASMAGEAGRGFAVVADEVQRLAERSTNATKQIEVLVRTIQADTNEAVVSMERSTTDVVGGALLAENAGAALDEIEQVSNQIASLVQNISGSAREQSSVAADIDQRTTNLKEISDKTGRETAATAEAIRKLSELASQLRKTVAGFQLPDFGVSSGVVAESAVPADRETAAAPPSRTARQA